MDKCRSVSCTFDEDVLTRASKQHVQQGKEEDGKWERESVGFFLEMSVLTLKCPNGKPKEIIVKQPTKY